MDTHEVIATGLSVGAGGGGIGVLILALKSAIVAIAHAWKSRAKADEMTAETVQSAMDELRGFRARLQEENERVVLERNEWRERYEESERKVLSLTQRLDAMKAEMDDLRASIGAGARPARLEMVAPTRKDHRR